MAAAILRRWLAHPLTRGIDIDDPRATELRRRIIREKTFLRRIYEDWYAELAGALPNLAGPTLEIGSGAGFLEEYVDDLIRSELFACPEIDLIADGQAVPLRDGVLRAILMNNVLHHVPDVRAFFAEAARCVRPGGRVVLNEPWVTPWSRLVYRRLHHEPFEPSAREWRFPSTGPLSGANGALPWILFHRDRVRFEAEFPEWRIAAVRPHMPFRYLVSGGVSMRELSPGWSYPLWRRLEEWLAPRAPGLTMFAVVVLDRV